MILNAGFPKCGRLVGDNSGKMAKSWMKITKLSFWDQNSGGGGQANFSGSGGDPPSSLTRGNPATQQSLNF